MVSFTYLRFCVKVNAFERSISYRSAWGHRYGESTELGVRKRNEDEIIFTCIPIQIDTNDTNIKRFHDDRKGFRADVINDQGVMIRSITGMEWRR